MNTTNSDIVKIVLIISIVILAVVVQLTSNAIPSELITAISAIFCGIVGVTIDQNKFTGKD